MESLRYYNGRIKSYYQIVWAVSAKNVKLRYRNSLFGFLWSFLNPLLYLLIFIFIFNNAFPDIENYPLYAVTGLIFWTFFSATSSQIIQSVIDSSGILKSLNVPPIIFPISFLTSSLVNFLLSLIPFFILMYFFGLNPSPVLLLIFPGLILLCAFTLGFSLTLAAFNVFFRDVSMFYNTILPAIFYFTPIAYSFKLVPDKYKFIVKMNPLFHFIELFRVILYNEQVPSVKLTGIVTSISFFFLLSGIYVFNKLKKGFISHL